MDFSKFKELRKAKNFIKDKIYIAGPCSIESKESLRDIAEAIKKNISFLRGGAFKPRTSPYSFQGHKKKALKWLREVADELSLKTVTEVMSINDISLISEYSDILQVGARNMYNYKLLEALGKTDKTILLKRHFSATIEEFLFAAEYIAKEGNKNIILCERGIRTFEKSTRNTLSLASALLIKQNINLPVIIDPSHASGLRSLIEPLSIASISAGFDGLMIEVHNNPDKALSDAKQQITPAQYNKIISKIKKIEGFLKCL